MTLFPTVCWQCFFYSETVSYLQREKELYPLKCSSLFRPHTDYIKPQNGVTERNESSTLSVPVSESKPKQPSDRPVTVYTNLPGDLSKVEILSESCSDIGQLVEKCLNSLKIPSQKLAPYFGIFFLQDSDSSTKFYLRLPNETEMGAVKRKAASQLYLRKCVFSRKLEKELSDQHPTFSNFLFHQAKADLKAGIIPVESEDLRQKLTESFKLKNVSDTIDILHSVPTYNVVTFPHCASSVQKENPLKLSVDENAVYLKICDQSGTELDYECVTCTWSTVDDWSVESEGSFSFNFKRSNGKIKNVKMQSDLAQQMRECFDQVHAERQKLSIS